MNPNTHTQISGLICLILLFPAVITSIIRLRSPLPHPSSSAFAGIKGPIALAKTPQRIYLLSGILTQLLLGLAQFTFIQGFATLRAISLCIVDAFLTSSAVVGPLSGVLVIQFGALALVMIRMWLEQHVAGKEAAGVPRSHRKPSRPDTMATFGFDRKDAPPTIALDRTPRFTIQRRTDDLKGFSDVAISTPFNVRKEGSVNSQIALNVPPRQDHFLSPEEKTSYQTRGVYNPKTGGYTHPSPSFKYDAYDTYQPVSDIGIASTYISTYPDPHPTSASHYGQADGGLGTTSALLPPPRIPQIYQKEMSVVSSRYSQSAVGWNFQEPEPVRNSFMGFGNGADERGEEGRGFGQRFGRGPGGTIRER
jgi:hypothetical protein